jgi:membrane-bound ClpP family serine protease
MNVSLSRLIAGVFLILGGASLVIVSFFKTFWMLIYALPMLIIGIVILFNKSEDKIESRKDLVKGGRKK